MVYCGDRLGLFKNLAQQGSATSEELAERAHIDEHYAREWLGAMSSAGYLEYDPASRRFTLPPEHVPVLAQEGGPVFFGGVQEELVGMVGPVNQLMQVHDTDNAPIMMTAAIFWSRSFLKTSLYPLREQVPGNIQEL